MSFTHAPIKLEMIGKLFLRLQDYLVHIRESSRLWWYTSQRGSGRGGGVRASEVWFAHERESRLLRQQQRAAHVVGSGTPPAPMGTAYHRRRRLMRVHPC